LTDETQLRLGNELIRFLATYANLYRSHLRSVSAGSRRASRFIDPDNRARRARMRIAMSRSFENVHRY